MSGIDNFLWGIVKFIFKVVFGGVRYVLKAVFPGFNWDGTLGIIITIVLVIFCCYILMMFM